MVTQLNRPAASTQVLSPPASPNNRQAPRQTTGNVLADSAQFGCTKTQPQFRCSKAAQPKFGGWGRNIATGGLAGLAALSATVCLPIALIAAIPGLFFHPLLLFAGIMGGIPVGLGCMAYLVGTGGKKE